VLPAAGSNPTVTSTASFHQARARPLGFALSHHLISFLSISSYRRIIFQDSEKKMERGNLKTNHSFDGTE